MRISTYLPVFGLTGVLLLGAPLVSVAQTDDEEAPPTVEEYDPVESINKASAMLDEQMGKSPDKRVPKALLDNARCVVLFPGVAHGGLGIGGKLGRGMVSCRNLQTGNWGPPVFLRLTGLNYGLQVGFQSADVMMLIMSDKGLETLFSGKPLVGAGAGIAAGPVGRDATANIDVLLQTPVVTYTRSKGLYVGAVIEGAAITTAKTVNRELYGSDYPDARSLLYMDVAVPDSIQGLQASLEKYAPGASASQAGEDEGEGASAE